MLMLDKIVYRREALQCTRSSRRRLPNAIEVEPDSNLRMDLHTLYLEATGHKVNGKLYSVSVISFSCI